MDLTRIDIIVVLPIRLAPAYLYAWEQTWIIMNSCHFLKFIVYKKFNDSKQNVSMFIIQNANVRFVSGFQHVMNSKWIEYAISIL